MSSCSVTDHVTLAKLLSHRMGVMILPPHSGAGRTRVRVTALFFLFLSGRLGFQGDPLVAQMVESACNAGDQGSTPGWGKIPWRRKWHPTPVFFLPGKSYGWRNLAGYSPWGHKELDTTEWLCLRTGHSYQLSFPCGLSVPLSHFDRGIVKRQNR